MKRREGFDPGSQNNQGLATLSQGLFFA